MRGAGVGPTQPPAPGLPHLCFVLLILWLPTTAVPYLLCTWRRLVALAHRSSSPAAHAAGWGSTAALNGRLARLQDQRAGDLLQHAAGLCAAAALWHCNPGVAAAAAALGRRLCAGFVRPNIEWLVGAEPGEGGARSGFGGWGGWRRSARRPGSMLGLCACILQGAGRGAAGQRAHLVVHAALC
jgi:hypothetical protein